MSASIIFGYYVTADQIQRVQETLLGRGYKIELAKDKSVYQVFHLKTGRPSTVGIDTAKIIRQMPGVETFDNESD